MQANNHIKEENRTRARPCTSLAQARSDRSGERDSLTQMKFL